MTRMTETSLTQRTSTSVELTRHVMVDFNQMKTFSVDPLIMVEGDGITLTDHQGRRYIDGLSGVFAVSLGHGNEEIIDAIAAQHRRALVLVADHDHDRPGARARRRADPASRAAATTSSSS